MCSLIHKYMQEVKPERIHHPQCRAIRLQRNEVQRK